MSDGQSGGNVSSTEIRDDGALLRAVATRDKDAFQQLYARHSPLLFSLGWFIMLTRSRAIDRLRSRKTRARLAESVGKEETQITTSTTPAADAVASEAQRTVRDALGKLPDDQRVPIEMAYFGGLTQFEIAQKISQPLGTVKTRIRTGMIRLREQLGSVTAGKEGRTA